MCINIYVWNHVYYAKCESVLTSPTSFHYLIDPLSRKFLFAKDRDYYRKPQPVKMYKCGTMSLYIYKSL